MFYSCTCPNCGYHYTPPSVPLNLDWTQWQDITWYDDHLVPHVSTSVPFGKQVSLCLLTRTQPVCVSNLHINQFTILTTKY